MTQVEEETVAGGGENKQVNKQTNCKGRIHNPGVAEILRPAKVYKV